MVPSPLFTCVALVTLAPPVSSVFLARTHTSAAARARGPLVPTRSLSPRPFFCAAARSLPLPPYSALTHPTRGPSAGRGGRAQTSPPALPACQRPKAAARVRACGKRPRGWGRGRRALWRPASTV
ncbi:MAG: hypothetical protein J3K34DRAFT_432940 [Monoraphidium minutum]|nr:MAG: hypothetical protein J3K34DRAFT_432940 [Monoraphidium minutum]